jgi:hypothetical protein
LPSVRSGRLPSTSVAGPEVVTASSTQAVSSALAKVTPPNRFVL